MILILTSMFPKIANIKNEYLKDSLIDFLYDFSRNEKVTIIRGGGIELEIEKDYPMEQDEITTSLINGIKKFNGKKSFFYGTRANEYAYISTADGVMTSFLERLDRLGYPPKSVSKKEIDSVIQLLCDKSYVVRNLPDINEIKLTSKGIFHYENGNSFVKDYYNFSLVRRANLISLMSLCISILSLLLGFLFWNA